MDKRIAGYDFIRSFAILFVFVGHIFTKQVDNPSVMLVMKSLSPGLTMSLLGFISAALLTSRQYDFGSFLIRRFSRIYISLAFCLTVVVIAHALIGKSVVNQHLLLHFMGLTGFFDMFVVKNKATVGDGLWFITAINLMYLVYPLLQKLFLHPRRLVHLSLFITACTALNFVMYGMGSIWNVVISFGVGVYCGVNGLTKRLLDPDSLVVPTVSCSLLILVAALATAEVIPYKIRGVLFAFYPIAFVPVLFAIAKNLPQRVVAAITFFAGLSYEFYILHFYFINEGFTDFFPAFGLAGQILIGFTATFVLAFLLSRGAALARKEIDKYLLSDETNEYGKVPGSPRAGLM